MSERWTQTRIATDKNIKDMDIKITTNNGLLIARPVGKLDAVQAPEFGQTLAQLLAEQPDSCLIDLSEVTYISSSGLQVLLVGAKTAAKANTTFGVFGMHPMVQEIFTLSGFARFIASYPDKNTALRNIDVKD